jgi:predicted DCC family thiol-disulfide oxidoreductase YuxK
MEHGIANNTDDAQAVSGRNVGLGEAAAGDDSHPIVFFDGVCGMCNRTVDFLLARDPRAVLRFAPLQGETAQQRLGTPDDEMLKTIVLQDRGREYRRSAAVVRILFHIGGAWKLVGAGLWLIPRPLRDLGYRLIATCRYRLFGRKETCRMPTPAERERFLP